jgi:leucyl/phenylalanyl-tRNA---protein transferase
MTSDARHDGRMRPSWQAKERLESSRWQLPDVRHGEGREDLVAVGADLRPSTVLDAYRHGLFPMKVRRSKIGWWSPDPRGVLPLDGLRVTRSLAASCRRFDVTINHDFEGVMRACATARRDGNWIDAEFIATYTDLHDRGWAHSVEVWQDGHLVGGLYGVDIGGLFAGESMFHRATDASKVALVALVRWLRLRGTRLLDVQWQTDHLATLGVIAVPRHDYVDLLNDALAAEPMIASLAPTADPTAPHDRADADNATRLLALSIADVAPHIDVRVESSDDYGVCLAAAVAVNRADVVTRLVQRGWRMDRDEILRATVMSDAGRTNGSLALS